VAASPAGLSGLARLAERAGRPAPRDRAGSGTGSSPDPLRRPTAGSPGSGPRSWMSRSVANRPALRRELIRQGRGSGRFPAWTGAERTRKPAGEFEQNVKNRHSSCRAKIGRFSMQGMTFPEFR